MKKFLNRFSRLEDVHECVAKVLFRDFEFLFAVFGQTINNFFSRFLFLNQPHFFEAFQRGIDCSGAWLCSLSFFDFFRDSLAVQGLFGEQKKNQEREQSAHVAAIGFLMFNHAIYWVTDIYKYDFSRYISYAR